MRSTQRISAIAVALSASWLTFSPALAADEIDAHSAATFRNGLSIIQREGSNEFSRIHSANGSNWYFDAIINSQGLWES